MYLLFWMFCTSRLHHGSPNIEVFSLDTFFQAHSWTNLTVTHLFFNIFLISGAYSSCFYICQNLIEGSLKAWDKWLVNIPETSMCQVSLDPTDVDYSSRPFQRTEWTNYRGAEVRRSKQGYTDHQETWWSWSVFKYTRKGLMELEEDKYEQKGLMN